MGRPNNPGELVDQAAGLQPTHTRVAMLRVAGMTNAAIARYMDLTTGRVTQILEKPNVQKYILQITATFATDLVPTAKEVNQEIARSSLRAAKVVEEIMEDMHERDDPMSKRVALSSAQDILDRAGHKPATKIEGKVAHGVAILPEQLELAAQVAKELNGYQNPQGSPQGSSVHTNGSVAPNENDTS